MCSASMTSRILGRRWFNDGTYELLLEKPAGFTHRPGQRIRLGIDGAERDYSLASIAADDHLTLCIRLVAGGRVSMALAEADIGSPVMLSGPHGYFVHQPSAHRPVCVATGTGVAPFLSMLRSGVAQMILLHGVREVTDCYYGEVFRRHLEMRYVPCISNGQAAGEGYAGHVTGYIRHHLPTGDYDFYLCGRQDMVRDVIHLVDRQFPDSRIFTEVFY